MSLRPHRGQIPVVAGACGASSCLHPVTPALPQAPPNPEMFQWKVKALLTGSCLTTCSPPDCGLPGSSVRGILQAGVLERAAMPSSKGSFQSRDQTCMSCVSALQTAALSLSPQGSRYRLNRVLNRRHFHILTPQELHMGFVWKQVGCLQSRWSEGSEMRASWTGVALNPGSGSS